MLTQAKLKEAFKPYFDEIARCVENKCYFALLHLAVILPDICGALESSKGDSDGNSYMDWCKRYLCDPLLTPKEWWEIRCKLLHQGRTLMEKGRYRELVFIQPGMKDSNAHGRILDEKLYLDVGEMVNKVRNALYQWFQDLESNAASTYPSNVESNLSALVCERPPMTINENGILFIVSTSTATFRP